MKTDSLLYLHLATGSAVDTLCSPLCELHKRKIASVLFLNVRTESPVLVTQGIIFGVSHAAPGVVFTNAALSSGSSFTEKTETSWLLSLHILWLKRHSCLTPPGRRGISSLLKERFFRITRFSLSVYFLFYFICYCWRSLNVVVNSLEIK